jgi:hypothetical protein
VPYGAATMAAREAVDLPKLEDVSVVVIAV